MADATRFLSCLRLRHSYFIEEKGWVHSASSPLGTETDCYDVFAHHLAVFQEQECLAYLRVLPFHPGIGFMLDHEFSDLLSQEERRDLSREGAVELSRLVCRNQLFERDSPAPHALELLLKLLYSVSKQQGFSQFYIVVEAAWLKPFARRFGLPFRVMGKPHVFPDGTKTVAATATLKELEAAMQRHNCDKHAWYQQSDF